MNADGRIPKPFLVGACFWLGLACAGSRARAADDACAPLFEAMRKSFAGPTHIVTTRMSPDRGGKTETTETIYMGGKIFMTIQGKWVLSRMTTAQMQKIEEENRRAAKHGCRPVREETIDGEPAEVFHVHSESDVSKSDGEVWISRRSGMRLRQEVDTKTEGGTGHISMHFEYRNVQPPRL